mgnify:CR=1 FL=1
MPKIDIDSAPRGDGTTYPDAFAGPCLSRRRWKLGDAAGLTQFGVNLLRLHDGAWSSQRHWHEAEDEFVMVLEGEITMIEDEGETIMRAGECAAHKAGVANGHHLINRSKSDAVFLVVGTRARTEIAHYPDIDLKAVNDGNGFRYFHTDGRSY